jgi:hypothetical protein
MLPGALLRQAKCLMLYSYVRAIKGSRQIIQAGNCYCPISTQTGICIPVQVMPEYIEFKGISVRLDRLCGLVVRVLDYRYRGPGFDSRALQKSSGSRTGSTQPLEYN